MRVIEEIAYGETNTSSSNSTIPNLITTLLNKTLELYVQSKISRYKYKQAVKMAEPACKADPQNCQYYIMQALRTLGVNVNATIPTTIPSYQTYLNNQTVPSTPTTNATVGVSSPNIPLPPTPQPPKQDNTTKYLLIGGLILGGVLLAYILTHRS